jgi:uncharacterized membrane protein
MWIMVLGLLLFLGIHSTRIFADDWRERTIRRYGDNAWKGMYTLVSLIGFGLIVWGYSLSRGAVTIVWTPPGFTKHIAAVLVLLAFILIVSAYIPGNWFKVKLGHPMVLGVKVWALAHLFVNGKLANIVLFASFLVWAVLCFRSCRQRDRATLQSRTDVKAAATGLTIVLGVAVWALFAFWGHGALIGVRPFG